MKQEANQTEEQWKVIKDYEGLYQVSNLGRVKSLERITYRKNGTPLTVKEKILKGFKSKEYRVVELSKDGETNTEFIHKLVAQSFIPNPNNFDVVHHKDHNPLNNSAENLEWIDKDEHYKLHHKEQSKKVYQYNLDGKLIKIWESVHKASRELGCSSGNIFRCLNDKRKTACGSKWSYEIPTDEEVWAVIKGYELYEVSNLGRVRSNNNPKKPKILKQGTNIGGYKTVALVKVKGSCNSQTKQVHRLVAEAFIPNLEGKPFIDHIDTNPSNNVPENLRWVTTEENSNNPLTKARVTQRNRERAIERSQMVLVYDKDFTLLSAFTSTADCARKLDYSQGNIVNCCLGSLPHYHNLYFSYIPLTKDGKEQLEKQGEEKKQKRIQAMRKATKKWQVTHKETYNATARNAYYQKKYGMTELEFKRIKYEGKV